MIINVLISGGIDSLFVSIILKLLNYEILGIHIINWNYFNKNKIFKTINVLSKLLNFKIILINLKRFYKISIFLIFIKNYYNKTIINIDLLCNKLIKFKFILKFISKDKLNIVSSGHYLLTKNLKKKLIKNSSDINRNQSHFIYNFKKFFKKILFVLGKIYKLNIKKIFLKKIKNLDCVKPSKGICFINNKNLEKFLKFYIYKKFNYIKFYINKFIKKKFIINLKIKNFILNVLILCNKKNLKLNKNIKYLKCKINNSKFFLMCRILIINKKVFILLNNFKNIYKGQNVSIYYKKSIILNKSII